jgi:hypothetical protein
MENGCEIWTFESKILQKSWSLNTGAREFTKYRLGLVEVQEVTLDTRGNERAIILFFHGRGIRIIS